MLIRIEHGKIVAPEEKGVVGGEYMVQIRGYDGVTTRGVDMIVPEGTPPFTESETRYEFPHDDTRLLILVTGNSNGAEARIEKLL